MKMAKGGEGRERERLEGRGDVWREEGCERGRDGRRGYGRGSG